jgi:hypothetical protein
MRAIPLVTAVLLLGTSLMQAANAASPATTAPAPAAASTSAPRLDHVLLWGHGIDQATAVMAVKLGFQVRPGHDTDGLANRYVRLADGGFIELLGITRANPVLDPGSKADQQVLKGGAGARSFGIRSRSLEATRSALQALHFATTPMFSGPVAGRPGWRLFAFDRAPLSSSVFFIDYAAGYAPDQYEPANTGDYRVTREHPNGARQLSAIWLLSANADADRQALATMGYGHAVPVRLPALGARGYCVPVGPTALLALQPEGAGIAAQTLAGGGPRILGMSLGVTDLARARRWVERGYERPLPIYAGLWGRAFLAPTRVDLGLSIEFHAMQAQAGPCSGAAPAGPGAP